MDLEAWGAFMGGTFFARRFRRTQGAPGLAFETWEP
jgi:hypothetical protein